MTEFEPISRILLRLIVGVLKRERVLHRMGATERDDSEEYSLWKRFQRVLLTAVSKRFSCYVMWHIDFLPLRVDPSFS